MHRINNMSAEVRKMYEAGRHRFSGHQARQERLKTQRVRANLEASRERIASRLNPDGTYKWSESEKAEFYASANR